MVQKFVQAAAEVVRQQRSREGSISPSLVQLPPMSDSELWSNDNLAPGPNSTGPTTMNQHLVPPRHQQLQPPQHPIHTTPQKYPLCPPAQQAPMPVPQLAEPYALPPNLIWAPWGQIPITPFLTPLAAPNQYRLVSLVRNHRLGDATFRIETTAHVAETSQVINITEYKTANNILVFSANGKTMDIPRTLPNLYPTSLLAWDMGISKDFRHIPEVAMHNSRPGSSFYRPSYIMFTRISTRASNKRPRTLPIPAPHKPCTWCTLHNHSIVGAAEDFAIAKAKCSNCEATHYFQVEAKPSTVMSKRLFMRAIPTRSSSRVETRATCIRTGKDFSHMEVRDTDITLWQVNQMTLSNLLLRYSSSPSSNETSQTQSTDSSRTETPPSNSSGTPPGQPCRPRWRNTSAVSDLSNQLRELTEMDICQATMKDPNQGTHFMARSSPEDTPTRYGLVTTTAESPLQVLRQGSLLKPTGMMPIIAGEASPPVHPQAVRIAGNEFINHILPMKIDQESGFPRKVAGETIVSVQRVLAGESPTGNADDITDQELMDIFGITPIKQDHFSVLEAFATVVRDTETLPLTPPEARKAIITHSGITLLSERLSGTTPVTGRTKIPTLVCQPATRWRCSYTSRNVACTD